MKTVLITKGGLVCDMPEYGIEVYALSALMLFSIAMLPIGIASIRMIYKINKHGYYDSHKWRYTRSLRTK